jgi:hypothetical protein
MPKLADGSVPGEQVKMQGDSREGRRESLAAKRRGHPRFSIGRRRGGSRQPGRDGNVEERGKQSGMGDGAWSQPNMYLLGHGEPAGRCRVEQTTIWFRGATWGEVPLWATSRTLALSDARGSPVRGTVAWLEPQ